MISKFTADINLMNKTYKRDCLYVPTVHHDTYERLKNFKKTIGDEIQEGDEILLSIQYGIPSIDLLVNIADWLGDIIVYATSEARKYGIPIDAVLDIIMQSNMSKLGADGEPIIDEHGKFLKGPNYWKPEPKIKELLLHQMNTPPTD